MKASTRTHRWAPAHPEEAEDRGGGPYDVIIIIIICLFVAFVLTRIWGH